MPKIETKTNILNESVSFKDKTPQEIAELNEQARVQNENNGVTQLPDTPFEE